MRPVAVEAVEGFESDSEDPNRDSEPIASAAAYQLDPTSIEEASLALLDSIQANAALDKTGDRNKVVLAGYGFGGIVVKQAVIIANTTPKYYDVALNISSLVFFATPHRPSNRLAWEAVLRDMTRNTDTNECIRLLQAPRLVDSVSLLSHVFYRFAAKYHTTNFIEGQGPGNNGPIVGRLGTFNNSYENVVSWRDEDLNSLMFSAVDDLDKLESLRTHFTPANLSSQGLSEHLNGVSQVAMDDSYFEVLQSLSRSRWIVHENRSLDSPDDFGELEEVYHPLLSKIDRNDILAGASIQVTGPPGHCKSALVKLISQKIMRRSPVIVIDNFLNFYGGSPPTLYGVHVSFLHQIISQRPSLFFPVQKLMAEILRQEAWTTESLWRPLAAILKYSRAVDFLIVIYDFEGWPNEIRSWWSTLGPLVKSFCGSTFTFLTSSHRLIHNLTSVPPLELDLEKEYGRYKQDLIRVKTNNLFDQVYGSVRLEKGLSCHVKEKIISAAERFRGSFTAMNVYLVLLFQSFSLNTLDAITSEIEASPQTEKGLYELEITTLRNNPPRDLFWASSVVSWILWSMRPLRIEELCAIVAVELNDSSVAEFRPRMSVDMERDLRSQLGLVVAVESRYARIVSGVAREILSRDDIRKLLDLQNHSGLAKLCLHYITLILKDKKQETWKKSLSHVSWKHQTPDPRDPAMEFLDYACRFWPSQFLLVEEPDENLKDMVVQFLMTPEVGARWFQLYLLCNSQSAISLEEVMGISAPERKLPKEGSLVADRAEIEPLSKAADARQLAIHMASYVGLASIIPQILGTSISAPRLEMIDVRRDCSERAVAFLDFRSRYYLNCAIGNDDESAVKEWLNSNREQAANYLPLHRAIRVGSLRTSRALLDLLEKPAQTDHDGRTPLHLAAISGSSEGTRLLLGIDDSNTRIRGIDVHEMINADNNNSQTPLLIASRLGNIEASRLLLECGADLAIRDSTSKTALDYAVLSCPEIVESFAARDSAHIRSDNEHKPLHIAAGSGSVQTVSTLVSFLKKSGDLVAAMDAQDDKGKMPLYHAAKNGHAVTVKILLNCESSKDEEYERYQWAAELAAVGGHLATVKLLNSHCPKLKRDGILGEASGAGQLLVVEYLLRAKLASPDGDQRFESRPISAAASMGYNQVVRTLLRYKAAVNIEDARRQTPLHHAAENGRYNVARTLLCHHANVDALNFERETPLHSAAKAGRVDIIRLLLKGKRVDVNACSRNKETALHLAVKSPKAVETLLKAHSDPTATEIFGQTPLHMATREKYLESVDLLRKATVSTLETTKGDGRYIML